jgi:hypothetical protein
MAKIKYSALVADMRGKHNGSVHSKNTYGSYVRIKVTPVNPRTTFQTGVRQFLATISQTWRTLTQAQRDQWNSQANQFTRTNIFGDSSSLTGFNLYVRLNRNLQTIASSLITTPPSPSTAFGMTTLSIVADFGDQTLIATFTAAIPAGTKVVVEATPGESAGKQFVESEFRKIDVLDDADVSPADISAAYIAKYGAIPAVGKKVFVRFRPVNSTTGISGQALTTSTLVIA